MSGPDPSKFIPSATAILRAQPEDLNFETDFAELVSRFAAESGGGLTPELSADLALEIVLNEIVEQGCRLTGATGAAIVLERNGEMICRASSGATAPPLGSPIDTTSGLAGECLRTRRTQCCDDTLADQRADAEASERVGVRSVMIMPLLNGDEVMGLLELFSSQPFAFGVRDERALEVLADRTQENLRRALHPLEPQPEPEPVLTPPAQPFLANSRPEIPAAPEPDEPEVEAAAEPKIRNSSKPRDLTVWFLGIAVVSASVLLGVVLGRRMGPSRAEATIALSQDATSTPAPNLVPTTAANAPQKPGNPTLTPVSASKAVVPSSVPPGGLSVFQNGREVFRMPPAGPSKSPADGTPVRLASEAGADNAVQVPEETAVREVVKRVEPQYPEAARQQSIQGPVILDVHIGINGVVQDVQVVNGQPLLAEAARDAVQQWRFRPRLVNGRPLPMQTRITLNFRLAE